MEAQSFGGLTNQNYIARGATDRRTARIGVLIIAALLGYVFLSLCIMAYLGSLPRERPVVINHYADGSYMPYTENVKPDEAGKVYMLGHWFGCFRSAAPPSSVCGQTVAALLDQRQSGDVLASVQTYNQAVADAGEKVTPHIDSIVNVPTSPFEYQVSWNETVTVGPKSEVRSMLATAVVAFDDADANLHTDILTNPFGMYITALHVIDTGVKK
jgi:type IV secretory pathway TrbF-like protein